MTGICSVKTDINSRKHVDEMALLAFKVPLQRVPTIKFTYLMYALQSRNLDMLDKQIASFSFDFK